MTTCITLDLSNIDGRSQRLFLDPVSDLTFTYTVSTLCPNCGAVEFQVSYSPAVVKSGATSGLIYIPSSPSTTSSVRFSASSNLNDVNTYTITV